MHNPLFPTLKDEMPTWLNQPLNLTQSAVDNPSTVFNAFFECYNLIGIRYRLREWLGETMHVDQELIYDFLTLHDNIVKLVEAAWQYHQQENSTQASQTPAP